MHSGGVDFEGLIRASFPHLLPDYARDSISGSSLFLAALRSDSSSFCCPPAVASSSSLPFAAPPPPTPSTHLPSHRSQVGSGGAAFSHLSSPSPSQPPAPAFAPPSASPAPPPSPVVSAPATSHPLLPSASVGVSSDVPGWGAGPSFPTGVPPSQYYSIMRQSIALSPRLTLPPGLPLMTLMTSRIRYRVLMAMMTDDRLREEDHPQLPRFLLIRLVQSTAA